MTTARWKPPAGIEADPVANWLCSAARRVVPHLGAKSHAVVHVVANTLADDLVTNGRPPIELVVETTNGDLAISVTDGRNCSAKINGLLSHDGGAIQPLTRSMTVTHTVGRRGSTLRAVVPIHQDGHRTLRSRLVRRRRGRA